MVLRNYNFLKFLRIHHSLKCGVQGKTLQATLIRLLEEEGAI